MNTCPRCPKHFCFIFLLLLFSFGTVASENKIEMGISEYAKTDENHPLKQPLKLKSKSTTDHSQLKELQQPFANGPEVTKACLQCHNKAGDQFRHNKHWTWNYQHPKTGQHLGKAVLINNFCTNALGNEGMCAQCHAGYNMTDSHFDFDNHENMDCLVCHESTGTYYKTPTTTGDAACSVMFKGKPPIDWTKVAQSVTLPSRNNCGHCHFYGGAGDNVKHGDLSSVLFNPPKTVDVHMSADGENYSCVTCHVGEAHEWAGSRYQMTLSETMPKAGMPRETSTCVSCHSATPHPLTRIKGIKLNSHTAKVACETCHIPTIARGGVATKVAWDWRTMGRLKNGEGFKLEGYTQGNGEHRHTYKSIKGTFVYGENVQPVYGWFDGTMHYTTIDTKFDPKQPVKINSFSGSYDNPDAKIYPFKEMNTVQPYDKGNNTLVYMHLWGEDENALWGNYSFDKAIKAGMAKNNIPYSGEWDFIETYSYWPINHMVAPKEEALACEQCHTKNGRISQLTGFYLPARGDNKWLDLIGLFAVIGTLGGVLGHGTLRIIATRRRKTNG